MPRWPHLTSCPENFEDFADVVFVVGDQQFPAHSQCLASHSKLMQTLMRDSASFSKDKPLVLDQQLQTFSQQDLQTFLNHVYVSSDLSSSAEAHALLRVADMFDAGKLMGVAVSYLESASGDDMFATTEGILHWLLFAERFNLPLFLKKCANHAAIHYQDVSADPSFDQLNPSALKAVLNAVHALTSLYPAVGRGPKFRLIGPHNYKFFSSTDSQPARAPDSDTSELSAEQTYMCKYCVQFQQLNGDEVQHACSGHHGRWDWHLQKQLWQLTGNPAVSTKVLPRNALELADLIGSAPVCTMTAGGASW